MMDLVDEAVKFSFVVVGGGIAVCISAAFKFPNYRKINITVVVISSPGFNHSALLWLIETMHIPCLESN